MSEIDDKINKIIKICLQINLLIKIHAMYKTLKFLSYMYMYEYFKNMPKSVL